MVKRVLALLKMEVRELMREANITDSIRPRRPETEEQIQSRMKEIRKTMKEEAKISMHFCGQKT